MNQIRVFLEYLLSAGTLALILGGILAFVFGLLAAFSKGERTPKWIAWGTFIAGLIVLVAGIFSGFEGQQASKLLQSKTEEVAKLSQENAELAKTNANLNKEIAGSLTGGDSFCYLMPLPSFTEINSLAFKLNHFGKYPMYDVHITVRDGTINENVDYGAIFEKHFGFRQKTYTMGEYLSRSKEEIHDQKKKSAAMSKEMMEILNRAKIVDKSLGTITHDVNRQDITVFSFNLPFDRDHQEFSATIYARNGYFHQKFKFKVEKGQWQMSSRLEKSVSENENILLRELRSVGGGPWAVEIVK